MKDTSSRSPRRSRRGGPRAGSAWVTIALAALPMLAAAQQGGDVFASSSSSSSAERRPFRDVPERFPDCASDVYDYWQKTDEIDVLAEERRTAVEPEAGELVREINDTAAERNDIGDEILDCVRTSTIAQRPPLKAGIAENHFDLSAEKNGTPGPVLKARVPQLDPREQTPATPASGSSSSRSTSDVHGVVLPPQTPSSGSGESSSSSRSEVHGRILPSTSTSSGGGGAGQGGSGTRVQTHVQGTLLQRTELPGDPSAGGTVPNDFTRSYFFAQGMLQGIDDAGQATGGQMGQLMIASYYLLTGRPQQARDWLGLQPGQSVTLTELEQDLKDWNDVLNGDPTGKDLTHSYESGRLVAKQLTKRLIAKYGKRLGEPLGVPEMPSTPAPAPSTGAPNARAAGASAR